MHNTVYKLCLGLSSLGKPCEFSKASSYLESLSKQRICTILFRTLKRCLHKLALVTISSSQRRLQKHQLKGRTITLKVRFNDFSIINRSESLPQNINDLSTILQTAKELLSKELSAEDKEPDF